MRLFVYGTLMLHVAAGRSAKLVAALQKGLPATTRGELYAVEDEAGWYAALMPDPVGAKVAGIVHEIGEAEMAAIDLFERTGEDYDRRSVNVMLPNGFAVAAGAYCWRKPIEGLTRIEHGDFARWLDETGNEPYREDP